MADPAELPREELERGRDLGAATYLSAYIHLMLRELGIAHFASDTAGVNSMVEQMVEPMNIATEAIWRALMDDHSGEMEKVLERFRESLDAI